MFLFSIIVSAVLQQTAVDVPVPPVEPAPAPSQTVTSVTPEPPKITKPKKISSVIDLQPNAKRDQVNIPASEKQEDGKTVKTPEHTLELVNLNPLIGSWFVLTKQTGKEKKSFHIELQVPETDQLQLSSTGLKIIRADGAGSVEINCENFDDALMKRLIAEQKSNLSYSEICEKRALVRHQITGRQTAKEFVSGFLRDNLWGGEQITTVVKETFFQDKFLLSAKPEKESTSATPQTSAPAPKPEAPAGPLPGRIDDAFRGNTLVVSEFGIKLVGNPEKLTVGEWYEIEGQPGMYASVIEAGMVEKSILNSHKNIVGPLDRIETDAIALMIAFRKNQFDAGFMIGTDHPRVDWSERALESQVDKSKPGPDGIGTIEPLIGTGKVIPAHVPRTAASFIGGFKRSHSAFKWGPFAKIHASSHYGFIEQGVVLSRLIPGLSTILINDKNEMSIKTWTAEDDVTLLPTIKHARQNGVPLIDGMAAVVEPVASVVSTPTTISPPIPSPATPVPVATTTPVPVVTTTPVPAASTTPLVSTDTATTIPVSDASPQPTLPAPKMLPVPGALVNQWGPGNWSGSIESKLRALRAGLCQQPQTNGDYLIYGYFSTATPNAMARVFQAYGCDHALHLDMNALEHTYFAVYEKSGDNFMTQHLIKGMHVLDSKYDGKSLPRFLGSADNRDFFYLMRK
jgi:hypothetical protein